jgi:hypothetical protein
MAVRASELGGADYKIPGQVLRAEISRLYPAQTSAHELQETLDEIVAAGRVIQPAGPDDTYRFAHKVFYEYLVASNLIQQQTRGEQRLGLLQNDPQIASLYFEISADSDGGASLAEVLEDVAARDAPGTDEWILHVVRTVGTGTGSPIRRSLDGWLQSTAHRRSLVARELGAILNSE